MLDLSNFRELLSPRSLGRLRDLPGPRDLLKEYPAIGYGLAGVLFLAALGFTFLRGDPRSGTRGGSDYYLDLNTMTVFTADEYHSPVRSPSGNGGDGEPDGYRAYVYTCGEPFDADGMTLDQLAENNAGVAYISRYTDDARAAQDELRSRSFGDGNPEAQRLTHAIRAGHFIRSPDADSPWVHADSNEAYQILIAVNDACGRGRLKELYPPRRRP